MSIEAKDFIDPDPDAITRQDYYVEVHPHIDDPNLEVRVYRKGEDPTVVKGSYYLMKIAKLLFPNNFPDIHLAASDPSIVITDKINVDETRSFPNWGDGDMEKANEERRLLVDTVNKAGIYIDAYRLSHSWAFDTDGNYKFTNLLMPWDNLAGSPNVQAEYDQDTLELSIEKLPEEQKAQGLKYLHRLEEIAKQQVEYQQAS